MNIFKRCVCAIILLAFFLTVRAGCPEHEGIILDSTTISSFGALLGVFVGAFVTYWSAKRKQFSNLITKERLDFIKNWREYSTRFCELLTIPKENVNGERQNYSIDYYYYKLIFMCNPTKPESYIDQEIVEILGCLYKLHQELQQTDGKEEVKLELDQVQKQFIALMQANIAIEWHGIVAESRKGNLSDEQKENLRQEHYKDYLKDIKK